MGGHGVRQPGAELDSGKTRREDTVAMNSGALAGWKDRRRNVALDWAHCSDLASVDPSCFGMGNWRDSCDEAVAWPDEVHDGGCCALDGYAPWDADDVDAKPPVCVVVVGAAGSEPYAASVEQQLVGRVCTTRLEGLAARTLGPTD